MLPTWAHAYSHYMHFRCDDETYRNIRVSSVRKKMKTLLNGKIFKVKAGALEDIEGEPNNIFQYTLTEVACYLYSKRKIRKNAKEPSTFSVTFIVADIEYTYENRKDGILYQALKSVQNLQGEIAHEEVEIEGKEDWFDKVFNYPGDNEPTDPVVEPDDPLQMMNFGIKIYNLDKIVDLTFKSREIVCKIEDNMRVGGELVDDVWVTFRGVTEKLDRNNNQWLIDFISFYKRYEVSENRNEEQMFDDYKKYVKKTRDLIWQVKEFQKIIGRKFGQLRAPEPAPGDETKENVADVTEITTPVSEIDLTDFEKELMKNISDSNEGVSCIDAYTITENRKYWKKGNAHIIESDGGGNVILSSENKDTVYSYEILNGEELDNDRPFKPLKSTKNQWVYDSDIKKIKSSTEDCKSNSEYIREEAKEILKTPGFGGRFKPDPWQLHSLKLAGDKILLGHRPGFGKTINSILLAEKLRNTRDPKPLIYIVAPDRKLVRHWVEELDRLGFEKDHYIWSTYKHLALSQSRPDYPEYRHVDPNELKRLYTKDTKKSPLYRASDKDLRHCMICDRSYNERDALKMFTGDTQDKLKRVWTLAKNAERGVRHTVFEQKNVSVTIDFYWNLVEDKIFFSCNKCGKEARFLTGFRPRKIISESYETQDETVEDYVEEESKQFEKYYQEVKRIAGYTGDEIKPVSYLKELIRKRVEQAPPTRKLPYIKQGNHVWHMYRAPPDCIIICDEIHKYVKDTRSLYLQTIWKYILSCQQSILASATPIEAKNELSQLYLLTELLRTKRDYWNDVPLYNNKRYNGIFMPPWYPFRPFETLSDMYEYASRMKNKFSRFNTVPDIDVAVKQLDHKKANDRKYEIDATNLMNLYMGILNNDSKLKKNQWILKKEGGNTLLTFNKKYYKKFVDEALKRLYDVQNKPREKAFPDLVTTGDGYRNIKLDLYRLLLIDKPPNSELRFKISNLDIDKRYKITMSKDKHSLLVEEDDVGEYDNKYILNLERFILCNQYSDKGLISIAFKERDKKNKEFKSVNPLRTIVANYTENSATKRYIPCAKKLQSDRQETKEIIEDFKMKWKLAARFKYKRKEKFLKDAEKDMEKLPDMEPAERRKIIKYLQDIDKFAEDTLKDINGLQWLYVHPTYQSNNTWYNGIPYIPNLLGSKVMAIAVEIEDQVRKGKNVMVYHDKVEMLRMVQRALIMRKHRLVNDLIETATLPENITPEEAEAKDYIFDNDELKQHAQEQALKRWKRLEGKHEEWIRTQNTEYKYFDEYIDKLQELKLNDYDKLKIINDQCLEVVGDICFLIRYRKSEGGLNDTDALNLATTINDISFYIEFAWRRENESMIKENHMRGKKLIDGARLISDIIKGKITLDRKNKILECLEVFDYLETTNDLSDRMKIIRDACKPYYLRGLYKIMTKKRMKQYNTDYYKYKKKWVLKEKTEITDELYDKLTTDQKKLFKKKKDDDIPQDLPDELKFKEDLIVDKLRNKSLLKIIKQKYGKYIPDIDDMKSNTEIDNDIPIKNVQERCIKYYLEYNPAGSNIFKGFFKKKGRSYKDEFLEKWNAKKKKNGNIIQRFRMPSISLPDYRNHNSLDKIKTLKMDNNHIFKNDMFKGNSPKKYKKGNVTILQYEVETKFLQKFPSEIKTETDMFIFCIWVQTYLIYLYDQAKDQLSKIKSIDQYASVLNEMNDNPYLSNIKSQKKIYMNKNEMNARNDFLKEMRPRLNGMSKKDRIFCAILEGTAVKTVDYPKYVKAFSEGYVDCLFVSDAGIEGVDYKSCSPSYMICIDPVKSAGKQDQFNGRTVRRNSHKNLPPEMRKVEYISFCSSGVTVLENMQKEDNDDGGEDYSISTLEEKVKEMDKDKRPKSVDEILDLKKLKLQLRSMIRQKKADKERTKALKEIIKLRREIVNQIYDDEKHTYTVENFDGVKWQEIGKLENEVTMYGLEEKLRETVKPYNKEFAKYLRVEEDLSTNKTFTPKKYTEKEIMIDLLPNNPDNMGDGDLREMLQRQEENFKSDESVLNYKWEYENFALDPGINELREKLGCGKISINNQRSRNATGITDPCLSSRPTEAISTIKEPENKKWNTYFDNYVNISHVPVYNNFAFLSVEEYLLYQLKIKNEKESRTKDLEKEKNKLNTEIESIRKYRDRRKERQVLRKKVSVINNEIKIIEKEVDDKMSLKGRYYCYGCNRHSTNRNECSFCKLPLVENDKYLYYHLMEPVSKIKKSTAEKYKYYTKNTVRREEAKIRRVYRDRVEMVLSLNSIEHQIKQHGDRTYKFSFLENDGNEVAFYKRLKRDDFREPDGTWIDMIKNPDIQLHKEICDKYEKDEVPRFKGKPKIYKRSKVDTRQKAKEKKVINEAIVKQLKSLYDKDLTAEEKKRLQDLEENFPDESAMALTPEEQEDSDFDEEEGSELDKEDEIQEIIDSNLSAENKWLQISILLDGDALTDKYAKKALKSNGLEIDLNEYDEMPTDPDGNCFYHAVIAASKDKGLELGNRIQTPDELRRELYDNFDENIPAGLELLSEEVKTRIYGGIGNAKPEHWGGDIEAALIQKIFGLSITIVEGNKIVNGQKVVDDGIILVWKHRIHYDWLKPKNGASSDQSIDSEEYMSDDSIQSEY